jgi:hypothetical protein
MRGLGCGGFRRPCSTTVALAGVAGGRGQDQPGGGFRGLRMELVQDAGVGVGGEHDAGVPELLLHGFEVGAGAVGEAGRAVS